MHLGFQVCHSLSGVLRVSNSNVLMFCYNIVSFALLFGFVP